MPVAEQGNNRLVFVLYWLVVILLCLPPWLYDYFPTQDGPTHLYNVQMLLDYGESDHWIYEKFHELNLAPDPTWFGHAVIAAALWIMPDFSAGHALLLTLYVLLFGYALRFMVLSVNRQAGWLALLGLPFIYSHLLHKGFYAFSFSVPLALIFITYWVRHAGEWRAGQVFGLGMISLLLYLTHPVSMMVAYIVIAAMTASLLLVSGRARRPGEALRRDVVPVALACLPTLLLLYLFVAGRDSVFFMDNPPWVRIQHIAALTSLISFESRELMFTLPVSLCIAALGLWALPRLMSVPPVSVVLFSGVVAALLLALFFPEQELVTPGADTKTSGYNFQKRLQPYPWLLTLLWLACFTSPYLLRKVGMLVAVICTVGLLGLHNQKYAEFEDYIREWLSGAELVPPNSVVLQLNLSRDHDRGPDGELISEFVPPLQHASNWLCLQRQALCLENFEPNTGYFPLRFRPEYDPYRHIGGFHEQVPHGRFVDYAQRTGAPLDFVLLWRSNDPRDLDYSDLRRQLSEGFELVHSSPQHGYLELYRRRGATPGRAQ